MDSCAAVTAFTAVHGEDTRSMPLQHRDLFTDRRDYYAPIRLSDRRQSIQDDQTHYAWDLHKAVDGVASQTKVVF